MPDDKKLDRCPHCGHSQARTPLIRTHCEKCGKPLKNGRRHWPEPGLVPRHPASP